MAFVSPISDSINVNTAERYCSHHGKNEGNSLYAPYFHPDSSIEVFIDSSASRSNESDSTIDVTFSVRAVVHGTFGYTLNLILRVGGVDKGHLVIDGGRNTPGTIKFSNVTCTSNTLSVGVWADCSGDDCNHSYNDGSSWSNGTRSLSTHTINVPEYQNWTAPTNVKNVKATPNKVKPDGTVTVTWTKPESGTNSPVTYCTVNYAKNGGNRTAYDSNVSVTTTSKTINIADLGVNPGDTLVFDVDTYCTNKDGQGTAGWLGYVSSGTVTVYKDGCIYYKNSSGQKIECKKSYYKNSSSQKINNRYMKVKDSSGTTHIIDII